MAIDVSKELEDEIRERVKRGPFDTVEEFLRTSIAREDELRRQLHAAIEEGAAQAKRGELTDGETYLEELDQRLAKAERGE